MDDDDSGAEGSGPGTDPPWEKEWVPPEELPPYAVPDDMAPITPAYDGPSIGPLTAEGDEEGRRLAEEAAEQHREMMRELGQETPDSTKPEEEHEPLFETPAE